YLKVTGISEEIIRYAKGGGMIIGICGGFQMLGMKLLDPHRIESEIGESEGLGLLDIMTVMEEEKITSQSIIETETKSFLLMGYEIHMGRTERIGDNAVPFSRVIRRGKVKCNEIDGYASLDGRIWGTYLHGIFDNGDFLRELISSLYKRKGLEKTLDIKPSGKIKNTQYDELARIVRNALDMKKIYSIIGIR
ncbi:MAG: cobyric acid synthase CobQ, partial [bacterium]